MICVKKLGIAIFLTNLILWIFGFSVYTTESLTLIEKYREIIPVMMAEQGIHGLAVAIVDENGILWAEGFGYTSRDRRTPVSTQTIFSIQSATKPFTATAILKAVQEELLDLDEPITTYLPDFTVNSAFEEHPEQKISLRHLLSHTAGFTHEAPLGNNFDQAMVPFEDHIASISQGWLRFPVGSGYAYSNQGIDLAGYILQVVSGKPYAQYIEEELLKPLGMVNSTINPSRIASHPDRAVGHAKPFSQVPVNIPMPAAGGLFASVSDMALFLQYHLTQGRIGQAGGLPGPYLLEEMYTVPVGIEGASSAYALGIARSQREELQNCDILLHGGGGFGFLADMAWYPELGIGVVLLTNTSDHNLQGVLALEILDNFAREPGSVYYKRLSALPYKKTTPGGSSSFQPPLNLPELINGLALVPDATTQERWNDYVGTYKLTVWGVFDPFTGGMTVREVNGILYLNSYVDAREFQLKEVLPGLFFADNGEALNFRGTTPTWRNIQMSTIGTGTSSLESVLLAVCALIFTIVLLRNLLFRRTIYRALGPGAWLAFAGATVTALTGLLSIGLIKAIPLIIYAGFLGNLDLPLWQKAGLYMPLAYTIAATASLALVITVLLKRCWPLRERIIYSTLVLAAIVLVFLLNHRHLIGLF